MTITNTIYLGACLLIIPIFSAISEENSWSTNGPEGGRIYCISIHPVDNSTILVGTIGHGIYKSTDYGLQWQAMESDILHDNLRDLEFHPNFPDTIFAGTAEGMYRSLNGGATWSLMHPPGYWFNQIYDIEIHPLHDSLIFAVGSSTNVKSIDYGNTWVNLDLPWIAAVSVKVDPMRPDSVYVAIQSAHQRLSIFRSEDLGETWYPWHNDLDTSMWATDFAIDPINSDIQYLCGHAFMELTGICIEKTTDGGAHWFDITPNGLFSPWVRSITLSPSDHDVIYICTQTNGILKSSNGGINWHEINNGLDSGTVLDIAVDSVTGSLYLGTM